MLKYIVTLFDPPDSEQVKKVEQAIRDSYEGYHPCDLQGLSFLIATNDSLEVVARTLGLAGPEDSEPVPSGLVVKLNGAYTGRGSTSLVDWLTESK